MMGKICALFGHRHAFNLGNMEELKERLTTVLTTLIEKEGVDTFLVGGYGDFDLLAGNVTHTLKKKFPSINTWLVLAYGSELLGCKPLPPFDVFDYPVDIERCKKRYAIAARNQHMVRQADVIVCYVDTYGGAFKTLQFALKKNKIVINLANFDFSKTD